MLKQIVFSLVVVSFVVQAQAQSKAKEGGKARDMIVEDAAKKANQAGGARSSAELIKSNASKKLDQYLGERLSAKDKEVILEVAANDKVVAKALVELVKSKKAGGNALIDDAQTGALQALAKIPNLAKRIADNTLTADESAAYKLVVEVPSKARSNFDAEAKEVAADAIKAFADGARKSNSTIDSALKAMETKTGIKRDKLKEMC